MIERSNSRRLYGSHALEGDRLIQQAEQRVGQGLAPPPEIYRVELRNRVDWSKFPTWARPVDPQIFDGCCHEG